MMEKCFFFSTQTKSYGQNEIYLDDTKFHVKKELDKSQLRRENNDKEYSNYLHDYERRRNRF